MRRQMIFFGARQAEEGEAAKVDPYKKLTTTSEFKARIETPSSRNSITLTIYLQ